jgi:two-component system LytT family response regulator
MGVGMETIRALVVACEAEERRNLNLLLRGLSAIDVIGECSAGDELLGLVRELDADLVLLDAAQLPELLAPLDSGSTLTASDAVNGSASNGNGSARQTGSRFVVKRPNGRVRFVPVQELLWVEAARDYVRLHTDEGSHLIRDTMATVEERLDPREFVRIHRSTIVRVEAIQEIKYEPSGRCSVLLSDGSQRRASRPGRRRLEEAIGYTA